jgi:phospholipid/cholesterol/gamma-HCH transport system substrate-binding protein
METKVNYVVVGAFVLVLGTLFVMGVLWLASGAFQTQYDLYSALVDESVSGLNLSAPVKYSGVEVGKVRDMQLDPNNPVRVRLTFAIKHGTPIKENTVAVLKTQGLTGIAYVELTGGSPDSPPLRARALGEYPEIRTKASLSARLENLLTSLVAKLASTTNSINAILSDENQAVFKRTLADLSTVARTVAARKETLDAGIASAAQTFENSAQVTADLDAVVQRIGSSADALKDMGHEAARASARAGQTVETIGAEVKRFSVETLPALERLLGEMSVLTTSLRRLSEQTERNPRGLLFGRRAVAPGPGEISDARP